MTAVTFSDNKLYDSNSSNLDDSYDSVIVGLFVTVRASNTYQSLQDSDVQQQWQQIEEWSRFKQQAVWKRIGVSGQW